jgi:O-antigen/teichoic acid export membrane protein
MFSILSHVTIGADAGGRTNTVFARAGTVQAGATGVIVVSSGLLTLALARALLPGSFAAWTLFLAVLAYANHAHLGLIFGAQQLIPRLGPPSRLTGRARTIHDTAWVAIALPAGLFAVAGSVLWCQSTGCGDDRVVFLAALALFAQPLLGFVQASLRVSARFTLMSVVGLVSYAGPAVGVAVYWLVARAITVDAAVVSTLVASLVGLAVACAWIGLPRRIDPAELPQIVLHGLGPMFVGVLLILIINVDIWFLQAKVGRVAVGEWGIGLSVLSLSLSGVGAFSNVLYPTLVREHGLTGPRIPLSRWVTGLALMSIAWLGVMGLAAGPLLRALLPAYVAALSPAVLLAGVGLQLGLTSFSSNVLLAGRRYITVVAVFAAALGANAIVDTFAAQTGTTALALTKLSVVSAIAIVLSRLASRDRAELGSAWIASLSVYLAAVVAYALTAT